MSFFEEATVDVLTGEDDMLRDLLLQDTAMKNYMRYGKFRPVFAT